jgi:MAF protein
LSLFGLPFRSIGADVDERQLEGESPREMVMRLSQSKAEAVAAQMNQVIVLACDTIVAVGREMLGKPAGPEEATTMLRRLRGREHEVYSGLTVLRAGSTGEERRERLHTVCDETVVHMRLYSDAEIAAYVASGDPLDKAGAYAIQNASFHPVSHIDGCYANVMGLPLRLVAQALRSFGLVIPDDAVISTACASATGHPCCLATDKS